MKPRNWPKKMIYTPVTISTDVHQNLLDCMLSTGNPKDNEVTCPCLEEKRVYNGITIRKINTNMKTSLGSSHPLSGQYGAFATKTIEERSVLGEYGGEYLMQKELDGYDVTRQKVVNTWELNINGFTIYLHSGRYANEISLVNDYRGINDQPNTYADWTIHRGRYYFTYIAKRKIFPSEEILVDYGNYWGIPNFSDRLAKSFSKISE